MHLPSDEFDYKNDDRAYSGNEISQILKACDVGVRMMILLLCSSGDANRSSSLSADR
jgi:hypothetical protein